MVPLVTKWVNYMPRKGVKLEIVSFNSRISLTIALTNKKLGREMKLCDPTNIGMCQFISWKTTTNNLEQYTVKGACMCMQLTKRNTVVDETSYALMTSILVKVQ